MKELQKLEKKLAKLEQQFEEAKDKPIKQNRLLKTASRIENRIFQLKKRLGQEETIQQNPPETNEKETENDTQQAGL